MPAYIGRYNNNAVVGLTKTSTNQQDIVADTVFHSSLPYIEVVYHDLPTVLETSIVMSYYKCTLGTEVRNMLKNTKNQYMIRFTFEDGSTEIMPPILHQSAFVRSEVSQGATIPDTQYINMQFTQDSQWLLSGNYPYWYVGRFVFSPILTTVNGGQHYRPNNSPIDLTNQKLVSKVTIIELRGLSVQADGYLQTNALAPPNNSVLISNNSLQIGGIDWRNKNILGVYRYPINHFVGSSGASGINTSYTQAVDVFSGGLTQQIPSDGSYQGVDFLTRNNSTQYCTGNRVDWYSTPTGVYSGYKPVKDLTADKKKAIETVGPIGNLYMCPKLSVQSNGWASIFTKYNGGDSYGAYVLPTQAHKLVGGDGLIPAGLVMRMDKFTGIEFDQTTPAINCGYTGKIPNRFFDPNSGIVQRVGRTFNCAQTLLSCIEGSSNSNSMRLDKVNLTTVIGQIILQGGEVNTSMFFLLPTPSTIGSIRTKANDVGADAAIGLMNEYLSGNVRYTKMRVQDYGNTPLLIYKQSTSAHGGYRYVTPYTLAQLGFTPPGFSVFSGTELDATKGGSYTVPMGSQHPFRNVMIITLPVGSRYVVSEEPTSLSDYPSQYQRGVNTVRCYIERVSQTLIEVRLEIIQAQDNFKSYSNTWPTFKTVPSNIPQVSLCPIL